MAFWGKRWEDLFPPEPEPERERDDASAPEPFVPTRPFGAIEVLAVVGGAITVLLIYVGLELGEFWMPFAVAFRSRV